MNNGESLKHRPPRWIRIVRIPFAAAAVASLLASVILLIGPPLYTVEILGSFRVQLGMAISPLLLLVTIFRRWLIASILVTAIALMLGPVAPLWMRDRPLPEADHRQASFRILQLNLWASFADTGDLAPVAELIDQKQPDLVVFQELTPRAAEQFEPLLSAFPHRALSPQSGFWGLGIYSRSPIEDATVTLFTADGTPSQVARIRIGTDRVTIVNTHPKAPFTHQSMLERDEQMMGIAARRGELGDDLVVVGDFNVAPWSERFGEFLSRSGLHDSARGFGWDPTFPTERLVTRIPIDSAVVSPRIHAVGREVGPSVGSDHFPVTTDLVIEGG